MASWKQHKMHKSIQIYVIGMKIPRKNLGFPARGITHEFLRVFFSGGVNATVAVSSQTDTKHTYTHTHKMRYVLDRILRLSRGRCNTALNRVER